MQGWRHYRLLLRQNRFLNDLLIVILSVDVVFVALYALFGVLKAAGLAPEVESMQLNSDSGLASVWNYGKFMALIAALFLIWLRERGASLLIMIGLFLFMLLDDYYELHDQIARGLGEHISVTALDSLHPQNRGELFVYAAILAIAGPLLWLALTKARAPALAFIGALAGGLIMIGVFGVAVDVLHGALDAVLGDFPDLIKKVFNRLMTIIEDGGEMIAISFCVWLCLIRLWERSAD